MQALTEPVNEPPHPDRPPEAAADRDQSPTKLSQKKPGVGRKYRHVENIETFGYQPTPTGALPRPEPWIEKIICGLLESIYGVRDPRQFSRWVSHDVFEAIISRSQTMQRRNQVLGKRVQRPHFNLKRLIIGQPRDGVVEATAVVRGPGRVRAVALRMEGVDNRWMTTAFRML